MHLFITGSLFVLVVIVAFEIRKLRAQNKHLASTAFWDRDRAIRADEQKRIAFAALEAREDYTKDHQMLVDQARNVIEGEGGRPPGVWVGDEFVPVDAVEEGDIDVSSNVGNVPDKLWDYREPWVHLPGETYDWKQN